MTTAEKFEVLFAPSIDEHFDSFFAFLGLGVNPSGLRRTYRREALRLNTMSDAELAVIGITRAEIPAHVMRHRFPAHAPQKLRERP
jgi:hypothetical protein